MIIEYPELWLKILVEFAIIISELKSGNRQELHKNA